MRRLLTACAMVVALVGCAPTFPSTLPGPFAGKPCPKGTLLMGGAPPDAKRIWCRADKSRAKRSGPVINWSCFDCKDGASLHGRYVNGQRHGPWSLWSKDGQKLESGSWSAGKKVGQWRGWHDGSKMGRGEERYLVTYDGKSQLHGIASYYHANGKRKEEGRYTSGKKVGVWRTWHGSGKRHEEGRYVNDLRHGDWTRHAESGRLDTQMTYVRGELKRESRFGLGSVQHTQWRVSRHTSKRYKHRHWQTRDGRQHGLETMWHESTAKLAREAMWHEGKATGQWAFYRPDGSKMAGGGVKNGKKVCPWRFYDDAGKDVTRRAVYAKTVAEQASEFGVDLRKDPCTWTVAAVLDIAQNGGLDATLVVARWTLEQLVERGAESDLIGTPADNSARIKAAAELAERANTAFRSFDFGTAAVLHAAAILEADRVLGGWLLDKKAPPTIVPKSDLVEPRTAIAAAEKARALATTSLKGIKALLGLRHGGDKAARKAARIILGRIGLNKKTVRKLARRARHG